MAPELSAQHTPLASLLHLSRTMRAETSVVTVRCKVVAGRCAFETRNARRLAVPDRWRLLYYDDNARWSLSRNQASSSIA
jgi:hypothetical protein